MKRKITVMLCLLLAGSLAGIANAAPDLTAWQTQASTTPGNVVADNTGWTFDGTTNTAVSGYNYGALDASNDEATVEYIVNVSSAGDSVALGSMYKEGTNNLIVFKFEQWANTGTFGVTEPGVADYTFATASPFSQQAHIVFVRNSDSNLLLYVNGVLAETNTNKAWFVSGGVGNLGANNSGDKDIPTGDIFGVATYDAALDATQIADLYATLPPPEQLPPVWQEDPIDGGSTTEDVAYTGTLAGKAIDPNGDAITYAKVSGPAWLIVDGITGDLSGTPTPGDAGTTNTFVVSATDDLGSGTSTNDATLNIVVLDQVPPEWLEKPVNGGTAQVDDAFNGSLASKATDINGDEITFAKVSGPAWLSVASDGSMSGTPLAGDVGTNDFVVSATDVAGSGITVNEDLQIIVADLLTTVDTTAWLALAQITAGNVTASNGVAGAGFALSGAGIDYDYGALDALEGKPVDGSTVEYIYNLTDSGASLAMGSVGGWSPGSEMNSFRAKQWGSSGKFGITLEGYVDYTLTTDSIFDQVVHVVFVRRNDGGTMDMYVNGVLAETHADKTNWRMDGGAGKIGSNSNGSDAVTGTMFGVASYDVALDATAIADLYDALINGGGDPEAVSITITGPVSGGTEMVVSWTGEAGATYSVETNANLVASGSWAEFVGGVEGVGPISVTNTISGDDATFYRVIAE